MKHFKLVSWSFFTRKPNGNEIMDSLSVLIIYEDSIRLGDLLVQSWKFI